SGEGALARRDADARHAGVVLEAGGAGLGRERLGLWRAPLGFGALSAVLLGELKCHAGLATGVGVHLRGRWRRKWGRHIGTHTTGGLTRSKGLLVTGEHVRVLFLHLLVVLDGLFGHPFLLQEVDEL